MPKAPKRVCIRCGEEGRVGNRVWPRSMLCTRCIENIPDKARRWFTHVHRQEVTR